MNPMKALFLGSHPDDIEAGAGGLLVKMVEKLGGDNCYCLVFATTVEQPGNEKILDELREAMGHLGLPEANWRVAGIPNTRFPENSQRIRNSLEEMRDKWNPDLVVTHYLGNTHQDHRCLAEQTIRVFRAHTILMYEDLKSTPHFVPNMVVSLTRDELERKVRLLESYRSQFRRHYHDMDYVRSIARMRGRRLDLSWGEAYHVYQMVLR